MGKEKIQIQVAEAEESGELEIALKEKVVQVNGIGYMLHKVVDEKKGEMFFVGKGSSSLIKYVSILKENITVKEGILLFDKHYSTAEISNRKSLFYKNWHKALKEVKIL